jgi:hypothetical protein
MHKLCTALVQGHSLPSALVDMQRPLHNPETVSPKKTADHVVAPFDLGGIERPLLQIPVTELLQSWLEDVPLEDALAGGRRNLRAHYSMCLFFRL